MAALLLLVVISIGATIALNKPEAFDLEYFQESGELRRGLRDLLLDENVTWTPIKSDRLNFGQTDDIIWIKLDDRMFKPGPNIIVIPFRQLDNVQIYAVDRSSNYDIENYISGDRIPDHLKQFATERIVFQVNKKEHIDVYLRSVTSGVNHTPLRIYSEKEFVESTDYISLMVLFFVGLAVLAIFNYLVYYSTYKLNSYLYYAIAVLGLMVFVLFHYRVIKVFLPNVSIETLHSTIIFGMILAFYAGTETMRSLFNEWGETMYAGYYRYIRYVSVIVLVSSFFLSYKYALNLMFVYLGVASVVLLAFPIHYLISRRDSEYWSLVFTVLISWAVLLVGALVQILMEYGLIQDEYLASNGLLIGGIGVVVCSLVVNANNLEIEKSKKIRAEKNLQIANELIFQTEQAETINDMSSGIIHEIKNPLTWLSSSVMIAKRNLDNPEKLNKYLDRVESGIERITETVNNLNWFVSSNKIEQMDWFSLREPLERTLSLAQSELSGIETSLDIEDNVHIYGSMVHIAQVFSNLLTNSIKAISKVQDDRTGHIQVSISQQRDRNSRVVTLSWADNGIGMSENELSRMADFFYTTDKDGTAKGLGMFIVSQILNGHRSEMSVNSTKGVGTRFTIVFEPDRLYESATRSP